MILSHMVTKTLGIPESQICTSINGMEAFENAMNDTFDIIIMDLNMPILNGFETSVKIKEFSI